MKSGIGAIGFAIALSACTPTPEVTEVVDAKNVVDALTYVKAKNGLCFGVATVLRMNSGGHFAQNQMIVSVDCAKAGL